MRLLHVLLLVSLIMAGFAPAAMACSHNLPTPAQADASHNHADMAGAQTQDKPCHPTPDKASEGCGGIIGACCCAVLPAIPAHGHNFEARKPVNAEFSSPPASAGITVAAIPRPPNVSVSSIS